MKQTIVTPNGFPTANLAINKSRIKIYSKSGELPIYYLEKGQEFQIELFNPTTDTVLAKIELNGTSIAQGGLVLRPGERVFLERYIDVAKKFKFDTYEVSNTEEVKKAIADNGDLRVQFFRESKPLPYYPPSNPTWVTLDNLWRTEINHYYNGTPTYMLRGSSGTGISTAGISTAGISNGGSGTFTTNSLGNTTASFNAANTTLTSSVGMDSLSFSDVDTQPAIEPKGRPRKKSKSIETGRVEMGAQSSQKLQYVDKTFDLYSFCTVAYKILPISQKVNTTEDLQVKRYCTNCGAKQKAEFKFCPTCGTKA